MALQLRRHGLHPGNHILPKGQKSKSITGKMGNEGLGEIGTKSPGHHLQQLIPLLLAVAGIIHLEIRKIAVHRHPATVKPASLILLRNAGSGNIKSRPVEDTKPLIKKIGLLHHKSGAAEAPHLPGPFILINAKGTLQRIHLTPHIQKPKNKGLISLLLIPVRKRHIPLIFHQTAEHTAGRLQERLQRRGTCHIQKSPVPVKNPLFLHRNKADPKRKSAKHRIPPVLLHHHTPPSAGAMSGFKYLWAPRSRHFPYL